MDKQHVVIDTDMALDDWMAILYLLKESRVKVEAISVAGNGIAHRKDGIQNAFGLMALANVPAVPVAGGQEMPLQGDHAYIRLLRKMMDRTLWVKLPELSEPPPLYQSAAVLLKETLENTTVPITILALGPLTTIAECLLNYPHLKDRINKIYLMGGAISVPGNVFLATFINNKVAECNIFIDPYAASVVFNSGIPITLIPLDITNTVPVDKAFLQELKISNPTPLITFIYKTLRRFSIPIWIKEYFFWDQLAAVILANPEIYTTEKKKLDVVLTPGKNLGQTQLLETGAEIEVVNKVDAEKFKQILLAAYRS